MNRHIRHINKRKFDRRNFCRVVFIKTNGSIIKMCITIVDFKKNKQCIRTMFRKN